MRRAVFIAPFDQPTDPRALAELGALAEARGWDGVFLWDDITCRRNRPRRGPGALGGGGIRLAADRVRP